MSSNGHTDNSQSPGKAVILPPISFLGNSGGSEGSSLASNRLSFGISSLLSASGNSSSNDHMDKKVKLERPEDGQILPQGSAEDEKKIDDIEGEPKGTEELKVSETHSTEAQEPLDQKVLHSETAEVLISAEENPQPLTEIQSSPSRPHFVHHHHHHHHGHAHSHAHHHHHHHHHRHVSEENGVSHSGDHTHAQTTSTENEAKPEDFAGQSEPQDSEPKGLTVVESKPLALDITPVVRILEELFPQRHYLGTIIYNPTNTWSTIQPEFLIGLKPEHISRFEEIKQNYELALSESKELVTKYIPIIPPLPNDYINYLVDIKIPYRFIRLYFEDVENGVVKQKRELWGGAGGIYTDDSDILAVLSHQGLFNDRLDLKRWNPSWKKLDLIKPSTVKYDDNNVLLADISVTVLLLPGLPSYQSIFNNGINSRSWSRSIAHTGLSYAVYNIKYESMGSYLMEKTIFKKYENELQQDKGSLMDEQKKTGWTFNYKLFKEVSAKHNEQK